MTKGERKIRPDFAKTEEVKEIKKLFTFLYDKINNLGLKVQDSGPHTPEVLDALDCYKKSLDCLETSAMYAVKGLTV